MMTSKLSFNIAKRRFTASDPNKIPKFKVEFPFESRTKSFANGRPLMTNGRRDNIRTFVDFLHYQRIPRMDFASVNGYPYTFSEPATKEEHIENQIRRAADAKTTLQPNGLVGWVMDREQDNYADYSLFDPKTLLVKQFRRKENRDGAYAAGVKFIERRYTYDEVDGTFRLVQMDFEEAASNFSPYTVVGTIQIEWLQFNQDQLELSSEETCLTSVGEKAEFFLKGLLKGLLKEDARADHRQLPDSDWLCGSLCFGDSFPGGAGAKCLPTGLVD